MENSNQSLSTIKRKYYALAKEVRGIESRVLRLEEEDEKQRRKLDNLKSKNHQYQDVKEAKHQRWADITRHNEDSLKQLEMYKTKNQQGRSYHCKVISELKVTMNQQRRANFKEMRDERDRNEKAIYKTKESFVRFNRSIRDKVVGMESESRNNIKQFWESKSHVHAEKTTTEAEQYKAKIDKLKKAEKQLEERERQILGSLEMTQSQAKNQQMSFECMTTGLKSIR